MTPLIVSADDYAQSAGIDAGILSLIRLGRLTAASCLTLSPRWQEAARLITAEIHNKADIGLHLDFTQYASGPYASAPFALPVLIARSLCRNLPVDSIHQHINSQLDQFEHALGTAPDYIDGHQHVHQLPQIRDVLLDILAQRYAGRLPWLRISRPPLADGRKALVLNLLGAHALRREARKMGLRFSDTLLGVYGFDAGAKDYGHRLANWLAGARVAQPHSVCTLMCHPALPATASAAEMPDSILEARLREYTALASPEFEHLLAERRIRLARGNVLSA